MTRAVDNDASMIERVMTSRFSCRAFRADPVPVDTIRRILSLAQHTPSWCNTQPWQVTVTSPKATDRLRGALLRHVGEGAQPEPDLNWPDGYPGQLGERRRASGYGLYGALGIERDDRVARARQGLRNFEFFGAPHAAIVTVDPALGAYGALDCGGYVASFLLAARACGVDSVAQAAIAAHPSVLRAELRLPEDQTILCGIAFGYADHLHPANGFRTERAALDEVVRWVDE